MILVLVSVRAILFFGKSCELREIKILSNTFSRINEDAAAEVSYVFDSFICLKRCAVDVQEGCPDH